MFAIFYRNDKGETVRVVGWYDTPMEALAKMKLAYHNDNLIIKEVKFGEKYNNGFDPSIIYGKIVGGWEFVISYWSDPDSVEETWKEIFRTQA